MALTVPRAATDIARLRRLSVEMRKDVLRMSNRAKSGHVGSAFSCVDLLACLYFRHLRLDPKQPRDPNRDRFVLSKGHACSALYAALARAGFFDPKLLETFVRDGSLLPGHPSSRLLPGVEASTGSLGHGLNIGVGMALAGKRDKRDYRTIVLLSDGECDEGSTWEACLAAAQWKLDRLTCIVDYNKIQSFGRVEDVMGLEPLTDKWRAFGWNVLETDGHDHAAVMRSLEAAAAHRASPSVVIAHTVKGKGVSFMENTVDWHYWAVNDRQLEKALAELDSSAKESEGDAR